MARDRLFKLTAFPNEPPAFPKSSVESLKKNIEFLEAALGRTLLINEALWELLRDRLHVTQDEFYKKLYEIDMRDGALDGKNQKKVLACPKCRRPNSGKYNACIYCGHPLDDSVFKLG